MNAHTGTVRPCADCFLLRPRTYLQSPKVESGLAVEKDLGRAATHTHRHKHTDKGFTTEGPPKKG